MEQYVNLVYIPRKEFLPSTSFLEKGEITIILPRNPPIILSGPRAEAYIRRQREGMKEQYKSTVTSLVDRPATETNTKNYTQKDKLPVVWRDGQRNYWIWPGLDKDGKPFFDEKTGKPFKITKDPKELPPEYILKLGYTFRQSKPLQIPEA